MKRHTAKESCDIISDSKTSKPIILDDKQAQHVKPGLAIKGKQPPTRSQVVL